MPDNDPEPEKYSIDDMMDRLRTRGGGPRDGEAKLVVREDGTQAYKTRKRKRHLKRDALVHDGDAKRNATQLPYD